MANRRRSWQICGYLTGLLRNHRFNLWHFGAHYCWPCLITSRLKVCNARLRRSLQPAAVFFRRIHLCRKYACLALPPHRTLTPEAFWQLVDDTISALRRFKSQPDAAITKELNTLVYSSSSRVEGVTLPDGKIIPLDTLYIAGRLAHRPYNLDSLINFFTNLHNSRNISPSRSFGAADLAALQSVLERPEFQWNNPPSPIEEWWNDLWAKINEWFNSLFGEDGVHGSRSPARRSPSQPASCWRLCCCIFSAACSAISSLKPSMDEEHMAGDELLTAETALQKAKEISRGGDYRTAVRYLYLSSLLTLDERGLLRFDRSKTNREYLRSVAAFPQLSAPLRDVIDVFDRVWYGFQSLDENGFNITSKKWISCGSRRNESDPRCLAGDRLAGHPDSDHDLCGARPAARGPDCPPLPASPAPPMAHWRSNSGCRR